MRQMTRNRDQGFQHFQTVDGVRGAGSLSLLSVTVFSLSFFFIVWQTLCLAQEPTLPSPDVAKDPDQLSSQLFVLVRQFRFEGNTVFTDHDLAKVLDPYLNRRLSSEDLEEARRALTLHYVSQGYINSGAILPDQTIQDGVILFQIVEGVLSEINIRGNGRLHSNYISKRVRRGAEAPLNINRLKDTLEPLRESSLIKRVNAELKPGASPGESYLEVQVEKAFPIQIGLQFSNRRPPSIGAERFELLLSHQNITGLGDRVEVEYALTKNGLEDIEYAGLDEISTSYSIPLGSYDTTLALGYSTSDILVIEEPFDGLDISSEYQSYGFTLRHPFYRTPSTEFSVAVTGERRHNETFLLGRPFSFSPGAVNGESDLTALRLAQEFFTRSQTYAIAARSSLSVGLNILGATENASGVPDGKFLVWLGQFQHVQSLSGKNQLISRFSTQLSRDPLLSMEQFTLGGFDTVRGYRENQLVRDNGLVSSFEFRLPVLFDQIGNGTLFIDPFFDVGYGWSVNGGPEAKLISSVGVGLLLNPNKHVDLQFYWGYPLTDLNTSEGNLQDLGIHFLANFYVF